MSASAWQMHHVWSLLQGQPTGHICKKTAGPWCGRGTDSFSHVQEDSTGEAAGKSEADGGVSPVTTSVLWPNRCPHGRSILDNPQNFSGATQRSLTWTPQAMQRPKGWALSGDMCMCSKHQESETLKVSKNLEGLKNLIGVPLKSRSFHQRQAALCPHKSAG